MLSRRSRIELQGTRLTEAEQREQTTIRLPAALKEQLQREAMERGISFNAWMLILIYKGLQVIQE